MDKQQAWNLVNSILQNVSATRLDHQKILDALEALKPAGEPTPTN